MAKIQDELTSFIEENIKLAKGCLEPDWPGKFTASERTILESAITYKYTIGWVEKALAGDRNALLHLLRSERIISVMTGRTQAQIEYARPIIKGEAASASGKQSGLSRRCWHPEAIKAAQKICDSSSKSLTQEQLATKLHCCPVKPML